MIVPTNTQIYETLSSTYWFDEDGIMCSNTKPIPANITVKEIIKDSDKVIKELKTLNKKFCMLIDLEYSRQNTREERENAAKAMPEITKALAVIVHNPLGRVMMNLFLGLSKPTYPIKIFKPGEEADAKEWLKQYF
jgi:hypothetical protein